MTEHELPVGETEIPARHRDPVIEISIRDLLDKISTDMGSGLARIETKLDGKADKVDVARIQTQIDNVTNRVGRLEDSERTRLVETETHRARNEAESTAKQRGWNIGLGVAMVIVSVALVVTQLFH